MARPTGYDVVAFGEMIECEPRMAIYAEALRRAVTQGCSVIDIGAGFGIFSILACKYGAGSVVAIEPDPSSNLLMQIAEANGCADRITVVQDLSTKYTPPTRADVIVSDIRGITPLFEYHIPTIVDARNRLLKPEGQLIPMRDTVRIAPVHAPRHYKPRHRPWLENNYGLDFSAAHQTAVNIPAPAYLEPDAFLSEPQALATLDYRTITDPNVSNTLEFRVDKAQTVHGLLVFFDAEIGEELRFSSGPGHPQLVYQQELLPFEQAVKLAAGDRITVQISAKLIDGQYVWSWNTTISDASGVAPRHSFRQSTFKGQLFSADKLRPHGHYRVPERSAKMTVDQDCLSFVGEGRSLEDIAVALKERHPGYFESDKAALGHVTKLLERYR